MARQLLDESFAALPADAARSLEFGALAELAAEESQPPARDERVLARAHQGNALRALGRLRDAGGHFAAARRALDEPDNDGRRVTDLAVYATLDWMEGTFRRELSEFNDAEELLNRAVLFFALLGSVAVVHQVVLSLGTLYFKRGNTRDALDAVAKVLANLDEGDDPRLYWLTRFNHAVYLAEAGLFEEAQKELAACLRAPGLRTVRDEFLADGHGINMALVSLDLAKLSLERDETAELRRLAEELVVVFSANDVHREALAALMLFQEAVRREAVTAGYLLRLRRYLDAARNNPCLEFERPS